MHSALWDTAARLVEMDASHVETQIICATPVMFAYDALRRGGSSCRRCLTRNDLALEFCAPTSGRIRAIAQVPAWDADLACRRADQAMRAGCVGDAD